MPETVKITYSEEFNIPRIPNYITRPDGGKTHIKNMPDKALKKLADQWGKELLAKAQKARQPSPDPSVPDNKHYPDGDPSTASGDPLDVGEINHPQDGNAYAGDADHE